MNRVDLLRPAALALILMNFIPLWGVIFWDWDVANILHLYWAENVIYGLITILRILTNQHRGKTFSERFFLSVFFTIHYGLFCYGHSVFVFSGAILEESEITALAYLSTNWLVILGFFGSHLVSYFYNYLGRGEAQRMKAEKVMFLPYRRIVILQVTIILGGMAVMSLGSSAGLIAVLVIAKTMGDLVLHFREHRKSSFLIQKRKS